MKHAVHRPTVGSIVVYYSSLDEDASRRLVLGRPAVVVRVSHDLVCELRLLDMRHKDNQRRDVKHRVMASPTVVSQTLRFWDWPATPDVVEVDDGKDES
jgi:hypothetical protein